MAGSWFGSTIGFLSWWMGKTSVQVKWFFVWLLPVSCQFQSLTQHSFSVFSFRGYNWFWIFLVGPHVGAIIGVGIFHFLILEEDQTPETVNAMENSQAPIIEYEYQMANGLENQQNFSKLFEQRLLYRRDGNIGSNITQI